MDFWNVDFWKAAVVRAIRTMAQGAVALIGTDLVSIVDLNWLHILGCVATMGLLSVLTSLSGLPEVTSTVRYDDEVNADDVDEIKESEVGK